MARTISVSEVRKSRGKSQKPKAGRTGHAKKKAERFSRERNIVCGFCGIELPWALTDCPHCQ